MIKNNYFILTGAMGGGKSTILAKLAETGVHCVPEPARVILAEQRMITAAGVPELNADAFNGLMLARAIHNYQEKQPLSDAIVFDRAIPDMIAYANLFQLDTTSYDNASQALRYNPTVFYFAGWQEIYTTDEERKHLGLTSKQSMNVLAITFLRFHDFRLKSGSYLYWKEFESEYQCDTHVIKVPLSKTIKCC